MHSINDNKIGVYFITNTDLTRFLLYTWDVKSTVGVLTKVPLIIIAQLLDELISHVIP